MGHSSGKANESSNVCPDVIVGLGGNVGPVLDNLRQAVGEMAAIYPVTAVSPLYRTAPIGPAQPDFLNAALGLMDCNDPKTLLPQLQEIEQHLGRVRLEKWGPRTVDLDILWAGSKIISTSSLTVPHAELVNRAFALRPLLDVYSAAKDPSDGRPYQAHLASLSSGSMDVVAQGTWWEALSSL